MKNVKHSVENPASSYHGKCRPGCSDKVQRIMSACVLIGMAQTGVRWAREGLRRRVAYLATMGLQCATTDT